MDKKEIEAKAESQGIRIVRSDVAPKSYIDCSAPVSISATSIRGQYMKLRLRKSRSLGWSQILPLCLVLNLFLMRPSALGQNFTPVGMGIAVVLLIAHLCLHRGKPILSAPTLRADVVSAGIIFILYWLYVLPLSILNGGDSVMMLRDLLSSLVILICYGIILTSVQSNITFFEKFSTVVAVIGWSSCATLLLGAVVGFDALFLMAINVKGYGEEESAELATGAIYFPFSMLYTRFTTSEVDLMRFNGFFREAGIYQGAACFFLLYEALTRRSKWRMGGLIGGTIAAFSSMGIVLLLLTVGGIWLRRMRSNVRRFIFAATLLVVAYPVAMYTPYIGLEAKQDTHSASISDRTEATSNALEALASNPLGKGLYVDSEPNAGITLIAFSGAVGIIGAMLQGIILSGWRFRLRRNDRARMLICAPLLLTALLSQPIAGAPMMYVLPMVFINLPSRRISNRREMRIQPALRHQIQGCKEG